MNEVVILGAGSMAKLVVDILHSRSFEFNILGFVDDYNDNIGKVIYKYKKLGDFTWFDKNNKNVKVIHAVSDVDLKRSFIKKAEEYKLSFINAIHKSAVISDSSSIGKGVIINAGAIIASDVVLEDHTFVNFNSTVGHDVIVRKFSSVMPGVNIGGNVILEEGSFLGLNSAIIQNNKIGKNSIVGAGSVVTKDISENTTVIGIPAKPIN